MKKKEVLIIDRSKWRTGGDFKNKTGVGETYLLNSNGYMCCLGFECRRLGATVYKKYTPEDVIVLFHKIKKTHLINKNGTNSTFTNKAMNINDNGKTTVKEKEKLIKSHFKTVGVTVKFIGEYKLKK